ncbi:MAG: type II toxin-antitoxin system HicB family antitoxin [Chloroflexota bacterium]|nr:type II toxin-antitoxin system HicB family antitoxin [Chloroflexota bacterium]
MSAAGSRPVRLKLELAPQPEGGYTVTCPALPELITEGDTFFEALANVEDALAATVELYEAMGREFPPEIFVDSPLEPVVLDAVAAL